MTCDFLRRRRRNCIDTGWLKEYYEIFFISTLEQIIVLNKYGT